jgi:hypothetical protein
LAVSTVVGVFRSEGQAEKAVEELRRRGFGDNEISIVGPDRRRGREGREGRPGGDDAGFTNQNLSEGGAWGAGIGGAAGLLAGAGALAIPGIGPLLAMGPLAATLAGAATGGIAGGLVDYGIPEAEGRELESRVKRGEFLCLIRTEKKAEDARRILKDCGAEDLHVNEGRAAGRR